MRKQLSFSLCSICIQPIVLLWILSIRRAINALSVRLGRLGMCFLIQWHNKTTNLQLLLLTQVIYTSFLI